MKLQLLMAAAALSSVATAQSHQRFADDAIRTNIPAINEGTLDLATGVITPPAGGQQLVTPGVVFDNTCLPYAVAPCNSVFISSILAGQTRIDDGRMPSTTSPAPNVGTMNAYRITSFVLEYYTNEGDPTIGSGPGARITVSFWENYDRCTELTLAGVPTKTFNLVLPGSATAGTLTGHLVNINLAGGFEFTMKADADGAYGGTQQLDNFGFGFASTALTAGATNYIVRAGQVSPNIASCGIGDGTYYLNPATAAGTGLDDDNSYWLQTAAMAGTCFNGAATNTGCAAPQNGPVYGGFYMELTADLTDCNANGLPDFDDIAAGAPDLNMNGIPDSCEGPPPPSNYCTAGTTTNGCLAQMTATGTASAAATSGFTLTCGSAEGQKQGIIFYGLAPAAGPWINGLGQGNSFLCVKTPTQRMGALTTSGTANMCDGAMSVDFLAFMAANPMAIGNPLAAGQVYFAQGWFRDPPSPKTTNLSNGITWTMVP